ncbi:MAG: hypothetical protein ACE5GM_03170 [bacterium]
MTEQAIETLIKLCRGPGKHCSAVTKMAQGDCIKEVLKAAAEVDHKYRKLLRQVADKRWDNWLGAIKQDLMREGFIALGGNLVRDKQPGDLLFIQLRFAPVDHLGLFLGEGLFLHYVSGRLCLGRLADFQVVSVGRI